MATLSNYAALPSLTIRRNASYPPSSTIRLQIWSPRTPKFLNSSCSPPLRRSSSIFCSTASEQTENGAPVSIVAIVGEGSISPMKSASWYDVMLHTAKKLKWVEETFEMLVFTDRICRAEDECREALSRANIAIIVAVSDQESVNWIQANCEYVPNVVSFDSSPSLANKLGGSLIQPKTSRDIFSKLPLLQPKTQKESEEVVRSVSEAWDRHNTDDIRFCLLVITNAYIRPVPMLKNLRAKGFSTLNCMVKNCGPQILNCLLDQNCRKALQCLNKCSPVDQVCNYRCIASYESRELEEFSLCVLQKNNCLELDASIPDKPQVSPMPKFQGETLDFETAEDLFIGWLGSLDWSWRVVCGQNPAYDQFPCQYQLFYRGKAKGSFWYEPVFQVKTLDGDLVWRRRKYRVRRGKIPGTFYFSVLDNGVVSNEFWTIVDVCDDLSWGLFHYHGAARVAGQAYTGAVVVTPDGLYPDAASRGTRLESALDRCGIEEWELFMVDNCSCKDPPLGLPEGSRLHCQITTA
ncbi:uncharacterized protein LOC127248387 [Andrographis paniculata]|uniref:uncharacterized protein LOC127248387 n=1 Tax=Andrographis paniculata TaxID=175694 RepID=UPI0021E6F56A|nr:uncharacterized protein LOC127248387 [Andrographis paniculata]